MGQKKFIPQKSFKTSGKHVLDNLRDKKNSEIAGVWGRSPQNCNLD